MVLIISNKRHHVYRRIAVENNFDEAFKFTMFNEGGFSNIPEDSGGATNFGITIKTLKCYRNAPVTIDDVRNLDIHEAKEIYKKLYWLELKCDKISKTAICICLFDVGVLFGVKRCSLMAQKALSQCGHLLLCDGIIGEKSISELNNTDANKFIGAFYGKVSSRIRHIVAANPKQVIFKKGWDTRASRLLTLKS
jgi:lysozyme family protein